MREPVRCARARSPCCCSRPGCCRCGRASSPNRRRTRRCSPGPSSPAGCAAQPPRTPAPDGDEPVLVDRDGDRLTLTLNRPERRNAYGHAVRDALVSALQIAVVDPAVTVELRGAGPAFCSGGDLAEFGTAPDPVDRASDPAAAQRRAAAARSAPIASPRTSTARASARASSCRPSPAGSSRRRTPASRCPRSAWARARRRRDGQHRAADRPLAHGLAGADRRRPRRRASPAVGPGRRDRAMTADQPGHRLAGVGRRRAQRFRAARAGRHAGPANGRRRSSGGPRTWWHPVRVDGAQLLAERAALTGRRAAGPDLGRRGLPAAAVRRRLGRGRVAAAAVRPRARRGARSRRPAPDPWEAVREWAATRTGEEIVERARLLGSPSATSARAGRRCACRPTCRRGDRPPSLVVDFSALWAGPLCSSLLGLAGARVVKVESVDRPDGARRGDPRFYELLHPVGECLTVDPSSAADRARLAALVRSADVVIEASRPRALAGWGLSAEEAAADGAVWLSITGVRPGERRPDRLRRRRGGRGRAGRRCGAATTCSSATRSPIR